MPSYVSKSKPTTSKFADHLPMDSIPRLSNGIAESSVRVMEHSSNVLMSDSAHASPRASTRTLEHLHLESSHVGPGLPLRTADSHFMGQYCEELTQKLKSEQEAAIRELSSKFETRLQIVEATLANALHAIESLSAKFKDPSESQSTCLNSTSDTNSRDSGSIQPTMPSLEEDELHCSVMEPSESPLSELTTQIATEFPTSASDLPQADYRTANFMTDCPDGASPKATRSQVPFEQLSSVLAEMATSWISGSQDKVEFEPELVHRMEQVCSDLQSAIRSERRQEIAYSSSFLEGSRNRMAHTPSFPADTHGEFSVAACTSYSVAEFQDNAW